MERTEYFKILRNWRGHYPAVVSTDGTGYEIEFRANYHEWRPNPYAFCQANNDDELPTYSTAEKSRKFVKKMLQKGSTKREIESALEKMLSGDDEIDN